MQGMAATIGVRAGKFLGVRKIFARISNLPKKFLDHFMCENFLMKTVLGAISSIQSTLGAIFSN